MEMIRTPAASVHMLLKAVKTNDADMVVGSRLDPASQSQFRLMNRLGDHVFFILHPNYFRCAH